MVVYTPLETKGIMGLSGNNPEDSPMFEKHRLKCKYVLLPAQR